MSDPSFGNFGFFGDIMKMLGQQGPDAWKETSRQLAANVVHGEGGDVNPDPALRQRCETISGIVLRRVEALLATSCELEVVSRLRLAEICLADWQPLLATGLRPPSTESLAGLGGAEMAPFMAEIAKTMGPLFLGFQSGSAAGHFALVAWSPSELPLPRQSARGVVVVDNVGRFASEWSVDVDQALCYANAHEAIGAHFLSRDGTAVALEALLFDAINDASAAQGDIMQRLTDLFQGAGMDDYINNPDRIIEQLGDISETPATARLDSAICVLRAAIDELATHVTGEVVGPIPVLTEALRRSQLDAASGVASAAAMFGVTLAGERMDRARAFVQSVVSNYGHEALTSLTQADGLLLPGELESAAAWYERVRSSPLAN